MALEMKPQCESCQTSTNVDQVAFICSYECTFCAECAEKMKACPNCAGELLPRPHRGPVHKASWMTTKSLQTFNEAWLNGDVEFLSKCITNDCVYSASVGPEPGKTYVGRQQVVNGFREIMAYEKGGQGESGPVYIFGNRGFSEWTYTKKGTGGKLLKIRGCDFFEFEGNKIRRKDAFIKSLPMDEQANEQ